MWVNQRQKQLSWMFLKKHSTSIFLRPTGIRMVMITVNYKFFLSSASTVRPPRYPLRRLLNSGTVMTEFAQHLSIVASAIVSTNIRKSVGGKIKLEFVSVLNWLPHGNDYSNQVKVLYRRYRLYERHATLYEPYWTMHSRGSFRTTSIRNVFSHYRHYRTEVGRWQNIQSESFAKLFSLNFSPSTSVYMLRLTVTKSTFFSSSSTFRPLGHFVQAVMNTGKDLIVLAEYSSNISSHTVSLTYGVFSGQKI